MKSVIFLQSVGIFYLWIKIFLLKQITCIRHRFQLYSKFLTPNISLQNLQFVKLLTLSKVGCDLLNPVLLPFFQAAFMCFLRLPFVLLKIESFWELVTVSATAGPARLVPRRIKDQRSKRSTCRV